MEDLEPGRETKEIKLEPLDINLEPFNIKLKPFKTDIEPIIINHDWLKLDLKLITIDKVSDI